jgi:hypothetical protein
MPRHSSWYEEELDPTISKRHRIQPSLLLPYSQYHDKKCSCWRMDLPMACKQKWLTSKGRYKGLESKATTSAPRAKANFTAARPDTPKPTTCNINIIKQGIFDTSSVLLPTIYWAVYKARFCNQYLICFYGAPLALEFLFVQWWIEIAPRQLSFQEILCDIHDAFSPLNPKWPQRPKMGLSFQMIGSSSKVSMIQHLFSPICSYWHLVSSPKLHKILWISCH